MKKQEILIVTTLLDPKLEKKINDKLNLGYLIIDKLVVNRGIMLIFQKE